MKKDNIISKWLEQNGRPDIRVKTEAKIKNMNDLNTFKKPFLSSRVKEYDNRLEYKGGIKMEFKGTKGKWKLAVNEYGYYTSVRNLDDTRKICVSRVNNFEETNANMKLISKAPEMLEMLKACILTFEQLGMKNPEGIEQLIKEATEL